MLRKVLILSVVITIPVLVGFTLVGLGEMRPVGASEATSATSIILPTSVQETPVPTQTPFMVYPTPTLLPTPTASPTPIANIYVVQPGDTFFDISQKLEVDWQILALITGMDNPDQTIYPGEVINVPDLSRVPATTIGGKQIIVVIEQQKVYAFDNGVLINTFVVSTGTVYHPTVLGNFQIAVKLTSTRMAGETYDLPNVPWTMYFGNDIVSWHEGYALHGAYWHNNFGHPMSHGCINMTENDAKWLFDWTPVGTVVTIIN